MLRPSSSTRRWMSAALYSTAATSDIRGRLYPCLRSLPRKFGSEAIRPQPNSDQKAWRVNRATATAPRRHHGDPAGAPLGAGEGDGPGAAADATTMDTAPSVRPFTTKRTDPTLVPAGSGSSSPGRTRTRGETFRTPAAGTSGDRSRPATTGRALVPTGTGARARPLLASVTRLNPRYP